MKLRDERIWIRDAVVTDAAVLTDWWNDGKVMAHAGFPHGLNTTEETVRHQIENPGQNHRLILGLDEKPIGEMNYRDVALGTAEIGIKICCFEYHEQGLGTRYLKMLLQFLKEQGYQQVILDTNLNNRRAQHVYEKIGFHRVRINENSFIDQDGVHQTSVDYALDLNTWVK